MLCIWIEQNSLTCIAKIENHTTIHSAEAPHAPLCTCFAFYFAIFAWTFLAIFKIELHKLNFSFTILKEFLLKEKYFIVIPILFIVGFDWGRWIFSLFHLSFFTFLILNNEIKKNKTWSFAIGAFILVSLLTIMPECCLQMEGTTVSSNYYRVLKSIQLTLQSAFG